MRSWYSCAQRRESAAGAPSQAAAVVVAQLAAGAAARKLNVGHWQCGCRAQAALTRQVLQGLRQQESRERVASAAAFMVAQLAALPCAVSRCCR